MQERNMSRKSPAAIIEIVQWVGIIQVGTHFIGVGIGGQHVERKTEFAASCQCTDRVVNVGFPTIRVKSHFDVKNSTRHCIVTRRKLRGIGEERTVRSALEKCSAAINHFLRNVEPTVGKLISLLDQITSQCAVAAAIVVDSKRLIAIY